MKTVMRLGMLMLGLAVIAGCAISPEEKMAREQALKQAVESFVSSAVQGDWNGLYQMTDGSFGTPDRLKTQLTQTWVQNAVLTGADVASMAWVNDQTAKVKLNWAFQSQGVISFSSETFVWVWKAKGWKYGGRAIR